MLFERSPLDTNPRCVSSTCGSLELQQRKILKKEISEIADTLTKLEKFANV